MTARLYGSGHLNAVSPNIECEVCGKSSPFAHCERCGKHHAALWHHEGQCTIKVDGLYCPNDALLDKRKKPMLFCDEHRVDGKPVADDGHRYRQPKVMLTAAGEVVPNPWIKATYGWDSSTPGSVKNQAPAFIEKSAELAAHFGQPESLEPKVERYEHPPITEGVIDRREFRSRSRPWHWYKMARMVGSGWVHVDAECMGWNERGHCRHVDELNALP